MYAIRSYYEIVEGDTHPFDTAGTLADLFRHAGGVAVGTHIEDDQRLIIRTDLPGQARGGELAIVGDISSGTFPQYRPMGRSYNFV